jgi:hypothetical protein
MITIKDYYELLQRLVQKDFDRFGGNPHKWNRVLEFEEGQKLIKIIAYTDMGNEDRQRSAFGFIVKEDFFHQVHHERKLFQTWRSAESGFMGCTG